MKQQRFEKIIKIAPRFRLPARQKQSSFFESAGGMYVGIADFYIVPISTITSEYFTFQRKCHSECASDRWSQKVQGLKYVPLIYLYCININLYTVNKLKCQINFATMYQKRKEHD